MKEQQLMTAFPKQSNLNRQQQSKYTNKHSETVNMLLKRTNAELFVSNSHLLLLPKPISAHSLILPKFCEKCFGVLWFILWVKQWTSEQVSPQVCPVQSYLGNVETVCRWNMQVRQQPQSREWSVCLVFILPKPNAQEKKYQTWIKQCAKPHLQVSKDFFVCSKVKCSLTLPSLLAQC